MEICSSLLILFITLKEEDNQTTKDGYSTREANNSKRPTFWAPQWTEFQEKWDYFNLDLLQARP